MSTDTRESMDASESIVPAMGAERGYELDESVAPLRISGFVCLILGLLSVISVVGLVLLLIPISAILFGLFALRRHGELVPVGTGAARIGLVLAVGFGSCGFFLPWMKNATLGKQAKQFGRDYIEVVAHDELELAMELRKDYVNRFPSTMPLKAHYSLSEGAEEQLIEFRQDAVNRTILARGPGAAWKLARPVRIFTHYQMQQAELVWMDPTGQESMRLHMFLEYDLDHRNGDGQWYVLRVLPYAEPIVAPLIL